MQKVFDRGLTNYESNPFGEVVTDEGDYTIIIATPDVRTGDDTATNGIEIVLDGITPGTYSGIGIASVIYYENENAWVSDPVTNDITVDITKYDDVGGVIEGTFSTTLVEAIPDSLTKVITDGEFKVVRAANNTLGP